MGKCDNHRFITNFGIKYEDREAFVAKAIGHDPSTGDFPMVNDIHELRLVCEALEKYYDKTHNTIHNSIHIHRKT